MDTKIGLVAKIEIHKHFAKAFVMAVKRQIAAQIEDLSRSPYNNLTIDWERLDKLSSCFHPKDLKIANGFLYNLEMVLDPVSTLMEYKLNTDSNRFPQTPKGLRIGSTKLLTVS